MLLNKKIIGSFFLGILTPLSAGAYQIVTSVPYGTDVIEQISCHDPSLQVTSLIPAGIDPHSYTITPKDRGLLEKAQMVVLIGAGLDSWSSKVPFSQKQIVITAAKELKLEKNNENSEDPHIWQSPTLTKEFALVLSKALQEQVKSENPNLANKWGKCTAKYTQDIDHTVTYLKKQIQHIPVEQRIFATNHDSLGYFAKEFGFEIFSILGISDDAAPTVNQIKHILDDTKDHHIKALFLETTGNQAAIKTLSKNTGIRIGGQLYGDSFGEQGTLADTTLGVWTSNVKTILQALETQK